MNLAIHIVAAVNCFLMGLIVGRRLECDRRVPDCRLHSVSNTFEKTCAKCRAGADARRRER